MTPDTVANEKTASKVVLFEYTLFSMAYFLFLGTNALYLSRYKAYDATTVGLLLLISAVAAKASRIALAGALDKISAKWLSITCALVTACGYISLDLTNIPSLTGVSLIVIGIGYATNSLLIRTLMAQIGRPGASTILGYAALSICANFSAAVGPFVGLMVLNRFAGNYHLAVAAVITAMAIPLVLASKTLPSLAPQAGWKAGIRTQLDDRRLLFSLGLTTAGWFLYSQIFSAMPLYVGATQNGDGLLGALFVLNAGIALSATLTVHRKLKEYKVDLHTSMGLSFVLYSIGSFTIWVFDTPSIMIISVTLWAFAEILLMPALQAHLADRSSPENRVVLFSLNAVAMGIGEGAGGFVGARLTMGESGPNANAFMVCACLSSVLSAVLLYARNRRKSF